MINIKYFLLGFKSVKGIDSPALALGASFIAISVDHEICDQFKNKSDFIIIIRKNGFID